MSLIDNYNKCLQLVRQEKWSKAKKVISSEPAVLHFCVSGEDSVLIVALKNFCSDDFLQFLIASGSDVNSKDCNGNTPLYHACVYHSHSGYFYPMKSLRCRMLFRAGARMTPFEELEIAGKAEKPDWELMKNLLRENPHVTQETNGAGQTLLEMYASAEDCDLFEFYLRTAQWQLNSASSPDEGSILGKIWESAHLVNPGDPPKTVKKRKFLKTDIIPELVAMGAQKLPGEKLFEHIVMGDLVALQEMLRNNPDMIKIKYHGEPILVAVCDAVCRFGLVQYGPMIDLFIRAGADVNASSQWGMNALHWAMKFGNEKLEKKFIALGTNINAKDNKGNTPLHCAMELCHYWPTALLKAGADVNAVNNDGETPLDWAQDGWSSAHTRQFRKALKQMGALSGKELKRGGKMKKLLLTLFALGTLFLTGCVVVEAIVMLPYLMVASGGNFVVATVGEHFDAWSDQRPRTIFSLEIPKGEPFEKICVDGEYKHVESDCRFVILYHRKGEFIWPLEFYVVNDRLGGEFTHVDRYKPVYEINPVLWGGEGCLISPEAEDEIVVLAASDTLREIGCFTVPFSKLNDFTGSYDENGFYNTCFFSGIFGKRFPHKVIKVPAWEKLSLLDGESKKYYLEKIFGESDRRRIRAQQEWKEYLQRMKED